METLVEHFGERIGSLRQTLQLRCGEPQPVQLRALQDLRTALAGLGEEAAELRRFLEAEQAQLAEARALAAQMRALADRTNHMEAHLPARLPNRKEGQAGNAGARKGSASDHALSAGSSSNTSTSTSMNNSSSSRGERGRSGRGRSSAAAARAAEKAAQMDSIAYVRVDEFEAVPHYIRGRVSRETINEVIDAVHRALAAKYEILATPRSQLGEPAMKRYKAFKEAEDDELGADLFFLEPELRELGGYKGQTKAALTILRHLHRIREHRSRSFVRYLPASA